MRLGVCFGYVSPGPGLVQRDAGGTHFELYICVIQDMHPSMFQRAFCAGQKRLLTYIPGPPRTTPGAQGLGFRVSLQDAFRFVPLGAVVQCQELASCGRGMECAALQPHLIAVLVMLRLWPVARLHMKRRINQRWLWLHLRNGSECTPTIHP